MRLSLPTILRTITLAALTTTTTTTTTKRTTTSLRPHNNNLFTARMPSIPSLTSFFTTNSNSNSTKKTMPAHEVQKTDTEWRALLSPAQFAVIRNKGTEAPYTGAYDKHMPSDGTYACAACAAPLYRATHKFKSGCGWPAYFDSVPGAVDRVEDGTLGMARTEITCARCGGHLGHVFKGEGYPTPTDERHCVNSVSLRFLKEEGEGGK